MERMRNGACAAANDVKSATTSDHCPVVLEIED